MATAKKNICTHIPEYEKSDLIAVRALAGGVANDRQQKNAFAFIINDLCQTHGLTYEPDSFDKTAFRAGRAFVGQVLLGMLRDESFKYVEKKNKD